jgi:hypothetical protein
MEVLNTSTHLIQSSDALCNPLISLFPGVRFLKAVAQTGMPLSGSEQMKRGLGKTPFPVDLIEVSG